MVPLRILVIDTSPVTRDSVGRMVDQSVDLRVGTPGWHLLADLERHPTDMVVFGHTAEESDRSGLQNLEVEMKRRWPDVTYVVYWGDPLDVVTSAVQSHRAPAGKQAA